MSCFQIYNEKIYDLLNFNMKQNQLPELKLRWSEVEQFVVEDLYLYECKNY